MAQVIEVNGCALSDDYPKIANLFHTSPRSEGTLLLRAESVNESRFVPPFVPPFLCLPLSNGGTAGSNLNLKLGGRYRI